MRKILFVLPFIILLVVFACAKKNPTGPEPSKPTYTLTNTPVLPTHTATITPTATLEPDSYENDDTYGYAKEIYSGTPQVHNIAPAGDEDWIHIGPAWGEYVVFNAAGPGARMNIAIYEWNSGAPGAQVADITSPSAGAVAQYTWNSAAPAYFIRITCADAVEVPQYTVNFTATAPTATPCTSPVSGITYPVAANYDTGEITQLTGVSSGGCDDICNNRIVMQRQSDGWYWMGLGWTSAGYTEAGVLYSGSYNNWTYTIYPDTFEAGETYSVYSITIDCQSAVETPQAPVVFGIFTATVTFTPTDSVTPTLTMTVTGTKTVSPTFTVTRTHTDSPTGTPTFTASGTDTETPTFTVTTTSTDTATPTVTRTRTALPTATPPGWDAYEPDNSSGAAYDPIPPQSTHGFHNSSDQDWSVYHLPAGFSLTISTINIVGSTDTVMQVIDGSTYDIDANGAGVGESTTRPGSGLARDIYVRITEKTGQFGAGFGYDLRYQQ